MRLFSLFLLKAVWVSCRFEFVRLTSFYLKCIDLLLFIFGYFTLSLDPLEFSISLEKSRGVVSLFCSFSFMRLFLLVLLLVELNLVRL